jgi:prepilin-type N-terminal cleavage/methylation domain-containing protein
MTHAPVRRTRPRQGFTLVELLVVIAIIGVLVALLLPAIQAAREAARRQQCGNNLKQLALGAQNYLSANSHFPTGGWGWAWVGDADRGFGSDQPGGWVYNLLPYIEQVQMHKLAGDGNRDTISAGQLAGTLHVLKSPLATIRCPSRRLQNVYPKPQDAPNYAHNSAADGVNTIAGRSDYAINVGDRGFVEVTTASFPGGGGAAPLPNYNGNNGNSFTWCMTPTGQPTGPACAIYGNNSGEAMDPVWGLTGVSFQRSKIEIAAVVDGTSNTYLIGEKFMDPLNYESGTDPGDNETWCTGFNNDNYRLARYVPLRDGTGTEYPDGTNPQKPTRFGSVHNAGWFVSWCDGHVSFESYDIDIQVHRANGNRADEGRRPL